MDKDMILDRLRGKKKKTTEPAVDRSEFLQIRPIRNPQLKWEEKEDKVTIIIPMQEQGKEQEQKKEDEKGKKRRKRKGLFATMTSPREKKIQLDNVGSIVWSLCDGERTNEEIIEYLHEKYKLLPSESEISLNTYYNELSKRGLIGFILPKETAARLAKKKEKQE